MKSMRLCDWCERYPAVRNYQKLWVRWKFNPTTEDYGRRPSVLDDQDPSGEENLHLCKICGDRFEYGETESDED